MDEEFYDVINHEYEENIESTQGENTKIKKGHVIFEKVNHSDRAAKFKVLSDGEVAEYVNIALEYFNNRCALSGERFEKFKGKIDRKISTNLSAEHVVALCQGGHDIIPNLVPSVLQYNISKNGYYILDWWKKQKDINGKQIYSPYRLLKLINFMIKSLEARKFSLGKDIKNYKKAIMSPNEIDEFLTQIEENDKLENDNNKKKIFSETITATTLDENNKKILTQIPTIEGNIPSHSTQIKERNQVDERVMMDIFLTDAVKIIEEQLPNEVEIHSRLSEKLASVIGEIPFEVSVRNIILQELKNIGIEDNKYSIANELLNNSDILEKTKKSDFGEQSIKNNINSYLQDGLKKLDILGVDKNTKLQLFSKQPSLIYDMEKMEDVASAIKKYKMYISKDIDVDLLIKPYVLNILEIKEWMNENKTSKPPRSQNKNKNGNDAVPKEEANLGMNLRTIRTKLLNTYNELESEQQKNEYKKLHPEFEIIRAIVEEIDKNNIPILLRNMIEIQEWMKENQTTRPPRNQNSNKTVPDIEAKLATNLSYIKQNLIKPYKKLKSEEDKEKYKKQHPELEEVMSRLECIERNNIPIKEKQTYYINMLKIKRWMEENNTTKPPRPQYKDKKNNKTVPEEEAQLGQNLSAIRQNLIKPYLKLKTEDEKKKFRMRYPEVEDVIIMVKEIDDNNLPIYLKNLIEIKEWMEERHTNCPPRAQNPKKTVPEEEAKLGIKLSNIRQDILKPYKEAKTKQEKEIIRKKYPYIDKAIKMLDEIGQNKVPINKKTLYYEKALEIKRWMEENQTTKPPRTQNKDRNGKNTVPELEAKLGSNLRSIRRRLINPYLQIENEQEKEEFRKQHYKIDETIKIIDEIDRNNIPIKEEQIYYINMLEIRKWMEINKTLRPPRKYWKDRNGNRVVPEEEADLGAKLVYIIQDLIKPYKKLESKEEKEEYKRKHPELEDVMSMIDEIDRNNPIKKKVKSIIVNQKNNGFLAENYDIEEEFKQTIKQVEQSKENDNGER